MIEEAHGTRSVDLKQSYLNKIAKILTNLLSQIRVYGEGLMIVEQTPAKLIPDAIKNTKLKIVHRLVAKDDRDTMRHTMTLTAEQATVINGLRRGQAIVVDNLHDGAAWVQVEHS